MHPAMTLVCGSALTFSFAFDASAALAQIDMKATAPDKMMSPADAKKLKDCEQKAEQLNIEMGKRAKFLMDCMKKGK